MNISKKIEEEIKEIMRDYREKSIKAELEAIWKVYDLYKKNKSEATRIEVWNYLYDTHQFEYEYGYFSSIINFRNASSELTVLMLNGQIHKTKGFEVNNRIKSELQPLFLSKNDISQISAKVLHFKIMDFLKKTKVNRKATKYLTDRLYVRYDYFLNKHIPKLIDGLHDINLEGNSVRGVFIKKTNQLLEAMKLAEKEIEKKLKEAKKPYKHPTGWKKK